MKRVWTLFCVLTIILLPASPVRGGETAKADFGFLKAVHILEEDFQPETFYVSRAEAAMLLIRAAGAGDVADARIFTDVAAGDPYAAEIATAARLGIISGFGDGTFHPKQSVTVNQMLKMLVYLLGYWQEAEAAGGYPTGYLQMANRKDLTVGLTAAGEAPLDYANMTKLMHAALNATVAEGVSYESGYTEYADTGVSVLAAWHGIDKVKGMVTADSLITISAERNVRSGEVAIDGKVYSAGNTDAAVLICQETEAYIDRESETVLYIKPRAADAVTVLSASDIKAVDDKTLTYETADKKEVHIGIGGAQVIKNGRLLPNPTAAELMFANGSVRLIASASGRITYIIAEEYTNRIVEYVSLTDNTVYFRDGGHLAVDPENNAVKTAFVEATGKPASLAYCYPWDIFSVMQGENVMKIIRSEKFVTGSIEELSTESITVGGKEYKLPSAYANDPQLTQPTPGMEADFYFDYTGALAAIDTSLRRSGRYGILVGAQLTKGLSPKAEVKLFTEEGKMQSFTLAAHVKVNGTFWEAETLLAGGSPIYTGGQTVRQLVAYRTQDAGTISELDTAADFTRDPDAEERLGEFSRDVYIDENRYTGLQPYVALGYQDGDVQRFGQKYLVRTNTKVFILPPEGADDKDYAMMDPMALEGGSGAAALNRVTLYDVDANYHVGAIVWEKESGASLPSHPHAKLFVVKAYYGVDNEGETSYYLEGYTENGVYKTLVVEDGMEAYFGKAFTDPGQDNPAYFENGTNKDKIPATGIIPGDLIQYIALSSGKATMLNVVARCNTPLPYELCYDSYTGAPGAPVVFGTGHCYVLALGTVKSRIAESFVTETRSRTDTSIRFVRAYPDSAVTILYNKEKGTSRKIKLSEIQVGDTVLTWSRTQEFEFAVVIR